MRFRRVALGLLAAALLPVSSAASPQGPAAAPVSVFPIPGSRYNRLRTQITFRGIAPGAIGPVTVVGSRTGPHQGRMEADSDGQGASFLPYKRFASGETVTVTTQLSILGTGAGEFSFAIGNVAPLIRNGVLRGIPPARASTLMHFRSRPGLLPAGVRITENSTPPSEGDVFVAPQTGPVQDGPMILGPDGRLVWFRPYPVSRNVYVTDFRVQDLHGQPVLTWWQGFRDTGVGQSRGVGVILNSRYQRIATVRAGNGVDAGSHEFLVTPQGDAYVTASSPVHLRGFRKPVIDSVVQEIDIKTGLVLFDWHALDHVPLSGFSPSLARLPNGLDPYHANSIAVDSDGNLLVSMRHTSAIYKIDRLTGRVIWTLGGKYSSFRMGPGTSTYGQHDVVRQPDGSLTIFDNGGGFPFKHFQSRGIRERLDLGDMTATLLAKYEHSPPLRSAAEGNVQLLPDGNVFIGWGANKHFSEDNAAGQQVFNGQFIPPIVGYRSYRFSWSAQPVTRPALAVLRGAHSIARLYASWNGATDVASWRVLAGPTRGQLVPVSTVVDRGFETSVVVQRQPYFAVQALGSAGQTLSTSPVVATPRRR